MSRLPTTRFLLPSLLLVAAFYSATPTHAQERVRAGYSGISGYQVPLWLGVDLGLFKKYGVNLEPILFRGGAESANALTGGEIQFDVVAPQPHIAADLSGADIIIIGTYFNKHTYSVVARPGIRAPQELRGKKIGVLSVIGLNQIVVATALRHWGIDEKSIMLVRSRRQPRSLHRAAKRPDRRDGAYRRFRRPGESGGHAGLARPWRSGGFVCDGKLADVQDLAKHQAQCCARFSPGDQRGDLYFQKRSYARTKEPVEVDAHAGQRSARKRLPELRAADFVSALYRTVRRPSRRRRPGEQLAPTRKAKRHRSSSMKISCASWIGRDSLSRYRKSKGRIKAEFAEPPPLSDVGNLRLLAECLSLFAQLFVAYRRSENSFEIFFFDQLVDQTVVDHFD